MGDRTVKIAPVGAWVEPVRISVDEQCHAVYAAQIEEERIQRAQQLKEEKLQHFQREVKKRVKKMQKMKKQQQLESSFKAVEMERSIVMQSSHAAERLTPKKNTCVYRDEQQLSIHPSVSMATASSESADDTDDGRVFEEHLNQVHKAISHARKNLASKRLVLDRKHLPGGAWKVASTRDLPLSADHDEVLDTNEAIEAGSVESDEEIPQQELDQSLITDDDEAIARQQQSHDQEEVFQLAGAPPPKVVTFSPSLGHPHQFGGDGEQKESAWSLGQPKVVTFASSNEPDEVLPKLRRRKTHRLCTHASVPEVMPGVLAEENKRQTRSQFSMYRRLFMDIEREQVKENIRKQEHRKKMLKLKQEKELERKREERAAQLSIEPRDPVTGHTEKEALEKSKQEQRYITQTMEKQKKKVQKKREMNRYIDALQAVMKNKIETQNIQLPPLCNCGPTIWDTNPDTCANNCVFYKNPNGYAKALQSVLMSCDVV
uniref:Coiled-coil domain-containing protein 15-like n=1 Tax=Saccoglossus kowalevskii TaxID=10224 RepID=A0ABM0GYD9_SACKO|nr:PREDICTED: coiled-coil domain-containing protein 15-like [Saccoglossus kowalevskii]